MTDEFSLGWLDDVGDERLYNAITMLDFDQKELLRFMAVDGLSHSEVAKKYGVTQQAVSYQMKQIRARITELWERDLIREIGKGDETKKICF